MKQPNGSKCRMCCKAEQLIKHIVMGYTTLVPSQYTNRQNTVTGYIHWMICQHTEIQITDKYYEHVPESVINANGTTIMWDVPVIKNRTILANQPHKVLHDKKQKAFLLTDVAIPDDANINMKETENQLSKKTWRLRSAGCGK
jgi:hypothetical protein